MHSTLQKLVNIASRIHKQDESRNIILADLASITPEEYQELSQGDFLTREQVEELKRDIDKRIQDLEEVRSLLQLKP